MAYGDVRPLEGHGAQTNEGTPGSGREILVHCQRTEERWCCVAWGNGAVVVTTRSENGKPALSTFQGKGIERHQVSLRVL